MKRHQAGFTIPELIIAISLSALVLALVMSFGFSYWTYGTAVEADLDAFVDRLNTSDFLREYIGNSSGLINQNSIADAHPGSIDTSVSPANYWTRLHAIPGTYNTPASGAQPLLYFRRPSLNASGSYIMNGGNPYEDEFVLFISSNKKLSLRTLANPSTSGNRQKTSCPAPYISASCPADRVLIKNVASVTTRYFSKAGNIIDYKSSCDQQGDDHDENFDCEDGNSESGTNNGPDFPAVEVVELTIKLTYKPVFSKQTTSNNTIIRIALRNT